MLKLGGTTFKPCFLVLFTDSSNTEAGSSPLKPLRILNVSMNRTICLICSRVHLFETLHVYPPNRRPELDTVLQQRPYQCPVQGKHRLLIPVVEHLLYIAQVILCLLLCSYTLRGALEVRRDVNPYTILTSSSKKSRASSKTVTSSSKTVTSSSKTVTSSSKTVTSSSKTVTSSSKTVTSSSKTVTSSSKTSRASSKTVTSSSKTSRASSKTVTSSSKTVTSSSKTVTSSSKTVTSSSKNSRVSLKS